MCSSFLKSNKKCDVVVDGAMATLFPVWRMEGHAPMARYLSAEFDVYQ